jgi:hypothetical protein
MSGLTARCEQEWRQRRQRLRGAMGGADAAPVLGWLRAAHRDAPPLPPLSLTTATAPPSSAAAFPPATRCWLCRQLIEVSVRHTPDRVGGRSQRRGTRGGQPSAAAAPELTAAHVAPFPCAIAYHVADALDVRPRFSAALMFSSFIHCDLHRPIRPPQHRGSARQFAPPVGSHRA